MNISELLSIRLYNQLLSGHHLKETHEVVSWMGAMQSQSLDMAKWAIGVRLGAKTVKDVEDDLNTGKIIRTHILRPTWHFVAVEDIHWMRELSYPRLLPIYISYGKMRGGDDEIIVRASRLIAKIVEKHDPLTKQEISERLKAEGIDTDHHNMTHILLRAELEGIICNGVISGNKHTYALLEERVPKTKAFIKEEALERLAYKFFSSHGPATLQDFTWWSGLLTSDAKAALELVKEHFVPETMNGRTFWMRNDIRIPENGTDQTLLLPPFDEFVVSYKDRSEIVEDHHYGKVMTKNGLFDPTIMLNGKIIGSWKKTVKKGNPQIEMSFFEKTPQKIQKLFHPEIKRLERFYSNKFISTSQMPQARSNSTKAVAESYKVSQ